MRRLNIKNTHFNPSQIGDCIAFSALQVDRGVNVRISVNGFVDSLKEITSMPFVWIFTSLFSTGMAVLRNRTYFFLFFFGFAHSFLLTTGFLYSGILKKIQMNIFECGELNLCGHGLL